MTDIVDFEKAKKLKDTGATCKMQMPDGSWWFKYVASYTYNDPKGRSSGIPEEILKVQGLRFPVGEWSIEFWARDDEDAAARVKAMRSSLEEPLRVVEEM